MSVRVMSWVWERSVSTGADRLVLLAIADSANDAGRDAYPAMATIARKANMDKRTAQRSVRSLVALGELAVLENAGPKGCHRYRIIMTGRQSASGDTPPVADDHRDEVPPVASDPAGGGISSPKGRSVATRTVLDPSITHPKDTSAIADAAPGEVVAIRQDVERLCTRLADRMVANGVKRPTITAKWRTTARLMLDRDGRTEQQIANAIDWCQSHEFWKANVLSMPALRDKYETLRLQAQRPSTTGRPDGGTQAHLARAAERLGVRT